MGVFDCIVAITTSDVVPRVRHRQPAVEGEKMPVFWVKFQRRIEFNYKIMGFVCSYGLSFNRRNMNRTFIHFIIGVHSLHVDVLF